MIVDFSKLPRLAELEESVGRIGIRVSREQSRMLLPIRSTSWHLRVHQEYMVISGKRKRGRRQPSAVYSKNGTDASYYWCERFKVYRFSKVTHAALLLSILDQIKY